jgi:NADH-quinone oxidoreductase subunit L
MTIPLWILAVLAIVGGYLGLPEVIAHGEYNWISHHWLGHNNTPVHNYSHHPEGWHPSLALEGVLIGLSIIIAFSGMLLSIRTYKNGLDGDAKVQSMLGGLYKLMQDKFYVDELYQAFIINPFVKFSQMVVIPFDKFVVDGVVNGSGSLVQFCGGIVRRMQNGVAQTYALFMVLGVLLMLAYLML